MSSCPSTKEWVPYYGHHSCKMFIRGKLTTFGFKIWTVSSVNDKEFLTDSPLMGRAHHHYVANSSKTSEWMDLRNVPVEDFTLAD
ncbi:hypothetical protein T02_10137 [Trichinella nativa]|uniref:PiggyBac transposable element-derived protein domain-containing protein n=1 Tax=Trichinella nativa TaxID=6335 RepID=A0A0V1L4G9_9BILA|nr:hypothetical protein T02_10137 [Trichinella nativa]